MRTRTVKASKRKEPLWQLRNEYDTEVLEDLKVKLAFCANKRPSK